MGTTRGGAGRTGEHAADPGTVGDPAGGTPALCAVCASVAAAAARLPDGPATAVAIAADDGHVTVAPREHVAHITALPRQELAAVLAGLSWLRSEFGRRTGSEVRVGAVEGPHVTVNLTVSGPGLPPAAMLDLVDGLVTHFS